MRVDAYAPIPQNKRDNLCCAVYVVVVTVFETTDCDNPRYAGPTAFALPTDEADCFHHE